MQRTRFTVLIGRAVVHVFSHAAIYAALMAGAFLVQAACFAIWHSDAALDLAGLLVLAVVAAGAYALVGAEYGVVVAPLERMLARVMLVVAIDILDSLTISSAFGAFAAADAFTGIMLLAVNVSLVYADVIAVYHEPAGALLFIRALGVSTTTAWAGLETIGRSIALVALSLVPILLVNEITHILTTHHVIFASFWATAVLGTIIVPPLSALTALVYLDATGIHEQRACGG